jgi:hypothetical protein
LGFKKLARPEACMQRLCLQRLRLLVENKNRSNHDGYGERTIGPERLAFSASLRLPRRRPFDFAGAIKRGLGTRLIKRGTTSIVFYAAKQGRCDVDCTWPHTRSQLGSSIIVPTANFTPWS